MKKYIIALILLFTVTLCKAQINLVPNPSFEIYFQCPDNLSQIDNAIPGFQPLIHSNTSDYYDTCNNIYNIFNTQMPRSGGGFAGIILYSGSWREYIEVKLLYPLI